MEIKIPDQLKKEGINFVLIEKNGKRPFEKDWQNKIIPFDDPKLNSHLMIGGNYGIRGGGDKNLIIVDFDDEEVQEKIINKLPKTFTVKTGSGLLHKYFYSDFGKSFKIFKENLNTIADIQGDGKQVVGAGSIHPNGKKYEVVDQSEIAFIPYSELKALLMPFDHKEKKKQIKISDEKKYDNSFLDDLKRNVSVEEVLNHFGIDTTKNPTQCLFHSSKGGKCLGFERDYCHCFHCDGAWNIFSLVMDYKKCDFKEALEILADIGGMQKELEENNKKFKEKVKVQKKIADSFNKYNQAEKFNEIQPIFYDRAGLFWLWNEEKLFWEIVDEVDILNMIYEATGRNIISSKSRTEILNSLKQIGRKNIPKNIKPTCVQFKDKIYDYETGEVKDANPEYFVTNPIPYKINGDDSTPNMDRIFEEWVGKEFVQTLYEILAYCCLQDYPIHRIFCFVGAGLNGKSKFLELLRKFIGDNNCASSELDRLLNSRFEVTRLHKKLVCQMGETNFGEMDKTSLLKQLSGGDLIGFEYKNKNPFEEKNYAKILIATNNLPTTNDKTIGFYRRWLIIDFPNQFSEKKDILGEIPNQEYNNLATKCFKILQKLMVKRSFHNEGSIDERMEKFENKSNPISKFIKETCYVGEHDIFVTKNSFKVRLNDWLKENKYREMSDIAITRWMKNNTFEDGKEYIDWYGDGKIDKKQARVWYGLKFTVK